MSPIPVVVCGRSPEIAAIVKQELAPEYDVIKTILSPSEGLTAIPTLLSSPNPPAAIALGGAFDDATVDSLRDAASKAGEVVWLRVDKSRVGEMPGMDDKEAFGKALAGRIKEALKGNGVGEGGTESGVVFF